MHDALFQSPARILPLPGVEFGGNRREPVDETDFKWKPRQYRYLRPATFPTKWGVMFITAGEVDEFPEDRVE